MNGSPPIGTSPGFVAPLFRTSLGPGEAPPAPSSSVSTARLNLTPNQASALGGATGSGGISVATGSGAATRPSFGERALAFMQQKFDAFCGKVSDLAQGVRTAFDDAKAYISSKIDALSQSSQAAAAAPPTAATPRAPLERTGTLQVVPGDTTSHASPASHKLVYDKAFEAATGINESNVNSFLRNENTHSVALKEANQGATDVLLADIFNARPDGTVALFQKTYNNGVPATDGGANHPVGDAGTVAQNSAQFLKASIERMFGSDPALARAAASNLSQATKDLMATGARAIDDAFAAKYGPNLAPDQQALRDQCKTNFAANVILRCINPQVQQFDKGNPVENNSMLELARCTGTLVNKGTLPAASDGTGLADGAQLNPDVHAALAPHEASMAQNIRIMLNEATRQGVAQVPTTSGTVPSAQVNVS